MDFDYTKEPGRKLLTRPPMRKDEALISIITPYYNMGKYLEQTFNCVMNQTFPWFEWIIVNDGSTEEYSLAILEDLSKRDKRITVIHQENSGLAGARNTGVQNSRTSIFIPLDADDLISPTYVECLYWALYFSPGAAWAYSDSCGFGAQEYLWKKNFSSGQMKKNNILVCTAAIRKSAFDTIGGYRADEKRFNEDWYFWLSLLAKKMYPVHVRGILFWYRRRNNGLLGEVRNDRRIKRRCRQLISAKAGEVKSSIPAIEYPRSKGIGRYDAPKVSSWDRVSFENNKIHVLMLLPWMEMGGSDLFNLEICEKLDKKTFELGIITTKAAENSWRQRFEDYVTDIFCLPDFLDVENWAEFISYYIKSREVDVLFLSNSYYGYYLLPWLRKQFPKLTIIDYVHMEEWYWRNGGYARISGVMGGNVEKTYVCNEHTRQIMLHKFGRRPESVETLYIGADSERYDSANIKPGQAKAALAIAPERTMILFPCRIHPQKRPFLMLEIAKALKTKLPGVAFAVVGDGPQLEELRLAVQREGMVDTVFFAGRQRDMRPWYKDSSVTLICSLKEGLALTAYESLSMEVPVVTSDVGGQAELVDETVGRVIPLHQSEEWGLDERCFSTVEVNQYVEAVTSLLLDQKHYENICEACRKRITGQFSVHTAVKKLETAFKLFADKPDSKRIEGTGNSNNDDLLPDEIVTLCCEAENAEFAVKGSYSETKNELMRLANSPKGRKLINMMFKLRLNKLF